MQPAEKILTLSSIELFKDLNPAEMEILSSHFEEAAYAANEMIFVENSPRRNLFIISVDP